MVNPPQNLATLSPPGNIPTPAQCVDLAYDLAGDIARYVEETERDRRVPRAAVDALVASGLMPLVRPARYGGYELGWMAFTDALVPLAAQSGSLAWVLGFILHHQWALAFFPKEAQDEVYSQASDPRIASMFAPCGRAEPVPGGLRLSGEWSFSSGVDNCDWVILSGFVGKGDGVPRANHWFLLKPGQFEVKDVWHSVGLAGSGSNNVLVKDALIEDAYTLDIAGYGIGDVGTAVSGHTHPLFSSPPMGQFPYGLIGPMYAIARALQEAITGFNRTREGLLVPGRLADDPYLQSGVGEAEAEITAVHALMERFDELILRGGMKTPDAILRCRGAMGFAAKTLTRAGERLFYQAGGRGLDTRNAISRHWRDLHAVTNHGALKYDSMFQGLGQYLLSPR
ncbi:acyl-CoA dehydrogenase family protein [Sphingobium sp. EM0848]|uniref:acyl-CoA dehydrogenase family protein n=1 Tax=Sphingobium sp. EM0848 TaxID=2743473 RepID=UPI00159C877B|nr:acyl-CoA dehydrogenase family protein [Sphingobium sp. EM0848]